jgi:hypothetical protein
MSLLKTVMNTIAWCVSTPLASYDVDRAVAKRNVGERATFPLAGGQKETFAKKYSQSIQNNQKIADLCFFGCAPVKRKRLPAFTGV